MLNFEEEVAKFSPSTEIDRATENLYDSISPDVADILEELLSKSDKRKNPQGNRH